MKKFHTLSLRESDVKSLGHRPIETLEIGAARWLALEDAERRVAMEDSEYYDFIKRCDKRKSDPTLIRSWTLPNEVFKAATQAGNGTLSAGVRCLGRLAVRRKPLDKAVAKESLLTWQTLTAGAAVLNELRGLTGKYFENEIWVPLAMQVWHTLPDAKKRPYADTSRQDDWMRKQEGDGVIAISGKLSKPDWDTIVNLGGGNRSRGARVVLRALLDVMRDAKTTDNSDPTKQNPS